MKKLAVWLMLAMMFFAVISGGCGGGSDSSDPEQAESLNEDTGEYDPNEGARGNSGSNGKEIDLSTLTANYTAHNGEILTGTLGANVKISIFYGATVTLRDVTINGENNKAYDWAGINCKGDAVIYLEGSNSVKGFCEDFPGIHVPQYKTLTIRGSGSLEASSNGYGAGIGGGDGHNCGNIVIDGGRIDAQGGKWAVGIGGGANSRCGDITITAGIGTATRGEGFSAPHRDEVFPDSIGAGLSGSCGKVTIYGEEGAISISPYPYPWEIIDLSTLTADYTANDREKLTGTLSANVKVSIADDATVTLRDATINGVDSNSYEWAGITCKGDATLILKGTNSVKGFYKRCPGIYVPETKTLTIKGSGSLDARSNGYGAGIGGGGNIVIEGGTITATGGKNAAGIGSGEYNNNITASEKTHLNDGKSSILGNIEITGGTINATGGYEGAGIGSGYYGEIFDITINGGKVTASAGDYAAGLGSGYKCQTGSLTIKDGEITATGGNGGAGLGGGYDSDFGGIEINGGTITAKAGDNSAGIGSAYYGTCNDIEIYGGTVDATGRQWSAAIGCGNDGDCGKITITNNVTKVTARKDSKADYSIGKGYNSGCGTITIGGQVYGSITTPVFTYS